jgi:hypothetical protein
VIDCKQMRNLLKRLAERFHNICLCERVCTARATETVPSPNRAVPLESANAVGRDSSGRADEPAHKLCYELDSRKARETASQSERGIIDILRDKASLAKTPENIDRLLTLNAEQARLTARLQSYLV